MPPRRDGQLTPLERAAIVEYLKDKNGSRALVRAGFNGSAKNAGHEFCRMKRERPVFAAALQKALDDQIERTRVDADRVIAELAKVGFVKATDLINPTTGELYEDIADEDAVCIAGIKVKTQTFADETTVEREIKLADKVKSLELLGRHLGLFRDNIRHSGPDGGPVQVEAKVAIYLPDNGRPVSAEGAE